MGLPVEVNNLMLGSLGGYTVGRSLRFRSSASGYLSRTPTSTGNRKIWTYSTWMKLGVLGTGQGIFAAVQGTGVGNLTTSIIYQADGTISISGNTRSTSGFINAATTAVYRDPSAWYHIVVAFDTTQATLANGVKVYINGVQQTISGSYTQNWDTAVNMTGYVNWIAHVDNGGTASYYGDHYQAEVNFVDGQQLTPSSFGAYDTNGVWQPKKYSGTYGTNGFYLNFSDNSAATAAAIGKDSSGNGNNWTPNNIDMTSNNYRSFTTGTYGWTAPAGVTSVNYLIVAGGGGGGNDGGGGGGAGGVLTGTATVSPGTTYSITVGAGGAAATNGSNSVMSGTGFTTLTAIGGGKGGSGLSAGSAGGSGGGGGRSSGGSGGVGQAGGAGTAGQGNNGGAGYLHVNGAGGGGGGAGSAGTNATNTDQFAGNGGAGIASTITGATVYYGGGGGGGAGNVGASNGTGGTGGGGNGGGSTGGAGTANTGGGGGGGQFGGTGGAGGSGIIILSYSGALQAGTTYDSMIDSPTNAAGSSTGIGNYAVLNPLYTAGGGTFSNGNLQVATGTSTAGRAIATMGISSGKWYWEITPTSIPANVVSIGFVPNPTTNDSGTVGNNASEYGYLSDGQKFSGGSAGAYGASYVANDVIGVALDLDAGTLVFYKNGTSQGTAYSSIPLTNTYVPAVSDSSSSNSATFVANFGQRPFAYTPPSGFKALNTYNLPAPSIAAGNKHFDISLWTGTGVAQAITNSGGFQPDLVWNKSRNNAGLTHIWTDSVRGVNSQLFSPLTNAQETRTDRIQSFDTSGFTVGTYTDVNQSAQTFVGWQWKGGGTAVTNNSGIISSTVSANPSAGFSIVTWTGNGSSSATVGHGLGVTPNLIIAKSRSAVNGWFVYHSSLSAGTYIQLNATGAANNISATSDGAISTSPTSTTFGFTAGSVGVNNVNQNTQTMVAYCFSAVAGYSAFGKYTGTGSSDGPFIYTGFRPRWVMFKVSSTTENWYIIDSSRNVYNVAGNQLKANLSDAEDSFSIVDFTSNGFKIRNTFASYNSSGATYIYAAFAESPFQISRAR